MITKSSTYPMVGLFCAHKRWKTEHACLPVGRDDTDLIDKYGLVGHELHELHEYTGLFLPQITQMNTE